jgi:hypothetical protein
MACYKVELYAQNQILILKTTMLYLPKLASIKLQFTLPGLHVWNIHILLPYYSDWDIDELSILIDSFIIFFRILGMC